MREQTEEWNLPQVWNNEKILPGAAEVDDI